MRLLIVNLHLDIGGVETLLVRLVPLLHEKGIHTTILVLQNRINPEFLNAISSFCTVKYIGDAFPFTSRGLQRFFGGEFDVAFYTISQALILGSWLLARANYRKTKVVLGAYQTEIFCAESGGWRYHRALVHRLIRKAIPSFSIIFGNTAGRDFHASRLGIPLEDASILRLFVDVEKYTYKDRRSLTRKKIVSIGRVTEYKTYNFTVLPIIRRLCDSGRDIEWHVYGDGDQFDEFKRAIKEHQLQKNVFAHGALNYSQFEGVLDDAFLFIGSGTSLIEAGACGVPALTTIEYASTPDSYGYICEIEGFNLIEPGLEKEMFSIDERIVELLGLSDEEYADLQRRCYEKAKLYSGTSIIQEYVDVFRHAVAEGADVHISSMQLMGYGTSAALGFAANKLKRISGNIRTIMNRHEVLKDGKSATELQGLMSRRPKI